MTKALTPEMEFLMKQPYVWNGSEKAASVEGSPEQLPVQGVGSVATGSVARRALKRDLWTRGFINAVATHWLQHGDPTTTKDLLRCGGRVEHILAHADEEDIATLQAAGYLPQNDQG